MCHVSASRGESQEHLPSRWSPNGKPWPLCYDNTGVGLDLDTLLWLEVDSSIQGCLGSTLIRAATPISSMEGSASGLIPSPENGPVHQRHTIWWVTPLSLIGLPEGSDMSSDFHSPDLVSSHSSFLSNVLKVHTGMGACASSERLCTCMFPLPWNSKGPAIWSAVLSGTWMTTAMHLPPKSTKPAHSAKFSEVCNSEWWMCLCVIIMLLTHLLNLSSLWLLCGTLAQSGNKGSRFQKYLLKQKVVTKIATKFITQNGNILMNKTHNANMQCKLVCAGTIASERVMVSYNLPKRFSENRKMMNIWKSGLTYPVCDALASNSQ